MNKRPSGLLWPSIAFRSGAMKRASRRLSLILFVCVLGGLLTQSEAGTAAPMRMGIQNCVTEWSFSSPKAYADPFNEVELDVLITAPDKSEQRVPAFWAGEQIGTQS